MQLDSFFLLSLASPAAGGKSTFSDPAAVFRGPGPTLRLELEALIEQSLEKPLPSATRPAPSSASAPASSFPQSVDPEAGGGQSPLSA